MDINGISVESIVGLVGLAIVVSASVGFAPLKAWFATRRHGFWSWLVTVMGEQLWIGFWAGWWWSVYCGNRIFESLLFGGGIAILAHTVHELVTYVSSIANRSARSLFQDQAHGAARRRPVPNPRNPKLSESEAHEIMDDHDRRDPNGPISSELN
jgi:hypothetical protein